jgi:uncharacterized membrane protein YhaH (DUF805 family)
MGIFNLLFTTKGRLPRSTFWLAQFVLLVGWIIVLIASAAAVFDRVKGGSGRDLESLTTPPAGLMIMFLLLSHMSFCVSAKRLHDLNKSALWMLAFQGPGMVLWLCKPVLSLPVIGLLYVAVFVGGLWCFIELGLFAGTNGPNRFDSAASPPQESGSSWADAIQFDERQPQIAAAPRIPVAAVQAAGAQPARPVRTAQVRAPAKPAGFGRRGLKPA